MLIVVLTFLVGVSAIGLLWFFRSGKSIAFDLPEAMFFFAYGIYLIQGLLMQSFLGVSFTGGVAKVVTVLCLGVLLTKELLFFRANLRHVVIAVVLFLLGAYVYVNIHSSMLVMIFALLYCARNVSLKHIVIFTAGVTSLIVLLVVCLALVGAINNTDDLDLVSGRARNAVGFRYALFGPALFLNVISVLTFVHGQSMRWAEWIFLFAGNAFLYYYTDSRLSFLLGAFILVVLALYKLGAKWLLENRFSKYLMLWSFPLAAILSYYVTWNYNPSDIMQFALNFVLEGRLDLGQDALFTYGFTLFGTPVAWVGNGLDENGLKGVGIYNWVDCAYIKVMIDYGVTALALYLVTMTLLLYRCYRRGELMQMLVLSMVAAHGIIDDLVLIPIYNTFLILIGTMLLIANGTGNARKNI